MRRGQVAIYLAVALAAICVLAVLNVSVFVSVRTRNRVQHAGDAAALAAARVQGELLNEIGRLNIRRIVAAARGDRQTCSALLLEQRRLALLGPIEGLRRADEAARANGMKENPDFSAILREHVGVILAVYATGLNAAGEPFPEPWPGAWREYADVLSSAVAGGLATGPDNCEFYGAAGGHLLLNPCFYQAIAGRTWCWFKFNALAALRNYDDYDYWGDLPPARQNPCGNCEVFSLHLFEWKGPLSLLLPRAELAQLVETFAAEDPATASAAALIRQHRLSLLDDPHMTWTLYAPDVWRKWTELSPAADFPVVGEVRPEYDVRGCATICRCKDGDFSWSAAAKPFGTVEVAAGLRAGSEPDGPRTVCSINGFVVPCFSSVRLVPLDAVGGSSLATADREWISHVRYHLPVYLEKGPRASGCFYCQQLMTWEQKSFRQSGLSWLRVNGENCRKTGGGPGGHGGTAHAH